jgi:hypothetical protein
MIAGLDRRSAERRVIDQTCIRACRSVQRPSEDGN